MKFNKHKIISIILARAGSKGLKNKNLAILDNKPLLYYAIEAAKSSKFINKVYVSTDSEKIKKCAIKYGAEVPFLRKKKFSNDNATTEVTLRNFLDEIKIRNNIEPEIIVYFQTTDIFRNKILIDKCIKNLIENKSVDSSFIVTPIHKNFWMANNKNITRLNKKKIYLPRQKKKAIYREDTGLCLATRNKCITTTNRIGKKIKLVINDSKVDLIDIHTKNDLLIANQIVKKLNIKPNFS